MVKPGDLGLMFSDSSAKDFCIEIDRVKVLQHMARSLIHHFTTMRTISLVNALTLKVRWESYGHAE